MAEECYSVTGYRPPMRINAPVIYAIWKESSDSYEADAVYAVISNESSFNPVAIGYKWKRKHENFTIYGPEISWGLSQPMFYVADTCVGRKVTPAELLIDHTISARIAVVHLRNTKTFMAYSAGTVGAKRGGGIPQARKMARILKRIPWVKKTKGGKLDWHYGKYLAVPKRK